MKAYVRPLISLIGMVGLTVGFHTGKVPWQGYCAIVTVVILYWFKERSDEKKVR